MAILNDTLLSIDTQVYQISVLVRNVLYSGPDDFPCLLVETFIRPIAVNESELVRHLVVIRHEGAVQQCQIRVHVHAVVTWVTTRATTWLCQSARARSLRRY